MKIWLCAHDLTGGGAQRALVLIANELYTREHNVSVVLMDKKGVFVNNLIEDIRVISLSSQSIWEGAYRLRTIVSEKEPHVIISFMPAASMCATIGSKTSRATPRLIAVEQNTRSITFGDVKRRRQVILKYVTRVCYKVANRVIAVSEGVKSKIISENILDKDSVRVISNPVNVDKVQQKSKESTGHKWLDKKRKFSVVVSAGRLVNQKSFGTLLRAMAYVNKKKRARLIILGEGKKRNELRLLSDKLGISEKVDFAGFEKNPWAYFSKADVFVLSSRYEGFGNVVVEALACGTPVVSTNCPSGPSSILDNGKFGRLVPVAEPDYMADAIVKEMQNPTSTTKLRKDRSRDFSTHKICNKYENVLQNIKAWT